jgi:GT2 family glycosyltransferase
MNPIPVLGIPHYNRPDLLLRCIRSIDHPVRNLVIVANGLPSETPPDFIVRSSAYDGVENVRVINHPNSGVAGSWNEIIKLFPAPWWMIANNDIEFAPGDLGKMATAAEHNLERRCLRFTLVSNPDSEVEPAGAIYGNHGASWFAITAHGVEKVGLFDENIYPAYLEDCDWSYRADLMGVRRLTLVGDVRAKHGDDKCLGSSTIMSDPALREKNRRTHGGNFYYYRSKWGGVNGQEVFRTPFDDPGWPVWAWKFDPAFRAKQQWC